MIDSSLLSLSLRISFAVTLRTILSSFMAVYRMTVFDKCNEYDVAYSIAHNREKEKPDKVHKYQILRNENPA